MATIQHIVTLAGHLAWPVTTIIILTIVRKELLAIFNALSSRILDPKTNVVLSKDGLGLGSLLSATFGKIESLESNQKQTTDLIISSQVRKSAVVAESDHESSVINSDLMALSDEYMNISVSDWTERVRLKDEYTSKLGNLVITRSISKDWLASQDREGLLMALTSAIHLLPDEQDFSRLVQISGKIRRLHIKYRIAMAIARVFELNLIKRNEIENAKDILDQYEVEADAPLKKRIEQTRAIIEYSLASRKNTSLQI